MTLNPPASTFCSDHRHALSCLAHTTVLGLEARASYLPVIRVSRLRIPPAHGVRVSLMKILFLRKGSACSQWENRDWNKREDPNYNTVRETCFLQDGSSLWCMSHEIQLPFMALPWPEVPSLCSVFLLFSSWFLQAIAVNNLLHWTSIRSPFLILSKWIHLKRWMSLRYPLDTYTVSQEHFNKSVDGRTIQIPSDDKSLHLRSICL